MNLSFEAKLKIGFCLVSALLLLVILIFLDTSNDFREARNQIAHTHEVIAALKAMSATMTGGQSSTRGYVLTGDRSYLEMYESARTNAVKQVEEIKALTADNPFYRERIDRLQRLVVEDLDYRESLIRAREAGSIEYQDAPPSAGGEGNQFNRLQALLADMEREERRLLHLRELEQEKTNDSAGGLMVILSLLISSLFIAGYRLIHRYVEEREAWRSKVEELNVMLVQRASALEHSNKELEAFSYTVSHDLRAPLRHITGFCTLLAKHQGDALDELGKRYLATISSATTRLGVLIDDLLVFARMGRAEMRPQRVVLEPLIRDVLTDFQRDLSNRNITLRNDELPAVQGDVTMLRQVFVNLLDNAIKYTRPRDPAVIEIGCDGMTDTEAVLFVRDNGVGFDMRYVNKLFGIFQRLHRVEEFEGTGIGLASVRRIIVRHGGKTWAEGKPGEGTTIFFTLPRADHGSGNGLTQPKPGQKRSPGRPHTDAPLETYPTG